MIKYSYMLYGICTLIIPVSCPVTTSEGDGDFGGPPTSCPNDLDPMYIYTYE